MNQQIEDILNLPENWDSYGSEKISLAAAATALAILKVLADKKKPWIVPCSDGGIQLEWHYDGLDLEIKINPDGETAGIYSEGWLMPEREEIEALRK